MEVRLFTTNGVISDDRYIVDKDTDRKGNYLLRMADSTKAVRAHPTRILPINNGGVHVSRTDSDMVANCPKCQAVVVVDIGQTAECAQCGQFELDWVSIEGGPIPVAEAEINGKPPKPAPKKTSKPRASRNIKMPATIDFDAMKKVGDIWTKSNVKFDYPDFDVRAHVFLINDGNPRKMCFNSYNGTYGKNSPQDEIDAFIANKKLGDKTIGYYITTAIEQQYTKLQKSGYVKE